MKKRTPKTDRYGIVLVNKPQGITSTKAVAKIKFLTYLPTGHMGTLDPLASGVLPIAVGNATRLFDYFLEKKKEYVAEFTFGEKSDTLDSTGTIERGGSIPTESEIEAVIPSLTGKVLQEPPLYSAKNVNGRRGYDLARQGVEFTLEKKEVEIDEIVLIGKGKNENSFSFKITCSAGTYIRSIARDMGKALNTNALMSGLVRTKSGAFCLENCVELDDLTQENIEKYILPTETLLPYESVCFDETDKIFCGVIKPTNLPSGLYKIYRGKVFYGVAKSENGTIKIKTKLC